MASADKNYWASFSGGGNSAGVANKPKSSSGGSSGGGSSSSSKSSNGSVAGYTRKGNDVYDEKGNYVSYVEAEKRGIVSKLASIPQQSGGTSGGSSGGSTGGSAPAGYYRVGNDVYDATGAYISFAEAEKRGIVPQLASIPQKSGTSTVTEQGKPTGVADDPATPQDESITGVPELDSNLGELQRVLDEIIATGKTLNPLFQITPDVAKRFLAEATERFSPFYKDQFALIKDDLQANLDNIKTAYETTRDSSFASFKKSVAEARESWADKGLAFSGVRNQGEAAMEGEQERSLASLGNQYAGNAGNMARTAEAQAGSRNLMGLSTPQFGQFDVDMSQPGDPKNTQTRTLDFWKRSDVPGSLERQQTTDVENWKNKLEGNWQRQSAYDHYGVS